MWYNIVLVNLEDVMDQEEWNAYVDFASSGEWPIPRGFISDYNNWICRSIVGRALYFRGKTEAAMTVLSTIVDIAPSMEKPEGTSMGEVEHKILCLRDLGKIVWSLTGSSEAALRFWNEAVDLCKKWPYHFNSVARGEISYGKILMLWDAGKKEQVEELLKAMEANDHFEMKEYNVNSYRYFANKFMAEKEYEAGNIEKAAILFEKAFKYYPMSVEARREEEKAKAMTGYKEKYEQFLKMSKVQYLQWEVVGELKGPVRG